jgi:hypothetical protein
MLEANKNNSSLTIESSSIRLSMKVELDYSHLSHSHLQKIVPLAIFTRLCPKIIQKTTILQQTMQKN